MTIREISNQELSPLLSLYTHLHDNKMPVMNDEIKNLWHEIRNDPNHHIIVGIMDDTIISSCVVLIIPNLTNGQRPYALVENVITHPEYRGKGYATQILGYAKKLAVDKQCYKIMLMTGSKKDTTLRFYEKAGYSKEDKTAFIQWLR